MSKPIHSRKQKDLINTAWHYVEYWAGRDMRTGIILDKAMKRDAKGRSCRQSSKALMMSLGLHIYASNPKIQELAREEPDVVSGGIAVFRCIKHAEDYGTNENLSDLITKCTEAIEIHRDAVRARIVEH